MKKLIALSFALLFLGAGMAGATDFTLKGDYYVRGSYFDNVQAAPAARASSFGNYDHELSVDSTWKIDDASFVFARFEMRDETWGSNNPVEGSVFNATTSELDDNIIVEQVYAVHKFANGQTARVGKMSSGAWATAFQDNGSEAYRVRYDVPTELGLLIGILQKNAETGNINTGENADNDSYILGVVTKAGEVQVRPLFVYTVASSNTPRTAGTQYDQFAFNLALDGVAGDIGYELEGGYVTRDWETTSVAVRDFDTWGLYGNVWMNAGALKYGILGAYGSYDDDANQGHDFGDDFEAGGALIMGDDITFLGSANDLSAGQLVAVYFDYAYTDKLSFGAYLGYAECGADTDNAAWDGASVYEISGDVTYAITPNVTYKVAAGTAQLEWGNNTVDPDRSVEVYHKLSFAF